MKLVLPLLVLIIALPFSSASIEVISELNDEYNLGEDVSLSLKITPEESVDALVKLTLRCTNSEIIYYVAPLSLEDGVEVEVEAPAIKAFSEGLCNIRANVVSLQEEDLDGIVSDDFTITDRLEISFSLDKTDVLPGDTVKIEGIASKQEGVVDGGSIVIRWDDKRTQIELDGSDFSYELELDEDIKSGEQTITVEINDSFENFGSESKVIQVEAIPTSLEFELNKDSFKPNEELEFKVNLLDQAGEAIDENVDVRLFKNKLFGEDVVLFEEEVNEEFSFIFDYDVVPDDYVLLGTFDELEAEEIIDILPYRKIEMRLVGEIVYIKNVGNVKYNNETTIMLDKDDKTYFIHKKIKLDVGEETTIDLSKEMPSGDYTVTLPETVVEERVVERTVETIKEVPTYIEKEVPKYIEREDSDIEEEEEVNVIENVEIEDKRPFYKKGLSMITGGVMAGAGWLVDRPSIASFLMIMIILSLVGYFGRGKIGKIVEKIRERREEIYSNFPPEK